MRIKSADGERMGRVARFLVTLLVVVVVVLTAIFIAVRTKGGHEFIRGWLEKRLGMVVTIGKARIGWPYVLVIEELVSKDSDASEKPILDVQELRIGLGVRTRWRVSVFRCNLTLSGSRDDRWNPDFFTKLGILPQRNIAEISRLTSNFRKNIALHVCESSIVWFNARDEVTTSASGISFDVMPVKLPKKKMYYHRLSIFDVQGINVQKVHDVHREWLASDVRDYIEIDRSTGGSVASKRGFWEAPEKNSVKTPSASGEPRWND